MSILIHGIPTEDILNTACTFYGLEDFTLSGLLNEEHIKTALSSIAQKLSVDAYLDVLSSVFESSDKIHLVRNTVPPSDPLYINRTLSKRAVLDPQLFKEPCSDIFVLKNISRLELRRFVGESGIARSREQLLAVTYKFILLDDEAHWTEICEEINSPAHLINYEEKTKEFYLERSKNISTIIRRFLSHGTEKICLSEEDTLHETTRFNDSGICICDTPGMGKSLLLENLGRTSLKKFPNTVVAFYKMTTFLKLIQDSTTTRSSDALLHYVFVDLSTSIWAQSILEMLVGLKETPLWLFLDGLDELPVGAVKTVTNYIRGIVNKTETIKIFMTSRTHTREELEDTLGVIAYDILPFCKTDQIKYLTEFWSHKAINVGSSKLAEFAKLCLLNLEINLSKSERQMTGIPFQCRLLAEICVKQAKAYSLHPYETFSRDGYFLNSLFKMYQLFVESKLCNTECQFHCMKLQTVKCSEL